MNTSSAATRIARRALLVDARLYLCTDSRASRGDLHEFLYACYEGDIDTIQLRGKRVDTCDEIVVVETLAKVAAKHGKLFVVSDRADIVALTGADILHVDQEDLTIEQAHQIVGPEILIDRSDRDLDMFAASFTDGDIDYAVIGSAYVTPTKLDRQPVGVDMVHETATLVRRVRAQGSAEPHQDSVADTVRPHDRSASDPVKPWWAIGGISAEIADEAIGVGAERIVVVRALTEAANPEGVARTLHTAVTGVGGIDSHGGK